MINLNVVSERTDKKRLEVSRKFGVNSTVTILSEGKLDYFLLKDALRSSNDSKDVILKYLPGGTSKKQVIESVGRGDFDFGIVDMDYDFYDKQVTSNRVISTKGSCCTFGMVSSVIDFGIIRKITIKATNHNKDVRIWLDSLRKRNYKNGKKLCEYIKDSSQKATVLRLFAGWLGTNKSTLLRKIPRGLHRNWLKDHLNVNIEFNKWCEDELEDDVYVELKIFESRFNEFIHGCGINDHDFVQALELLVTRLYGDIFDVGRFEREMKNEIRVQKSHMPKQFKSKLKQANLLA